MSWTPPSSLWVATLWSPDIPWMWWRSTMATTPGKYIFVRSVRDIEAAHIRGNTTAVIWNSQTVTILSDDLKKMALLKDLERRGFTALVPELSKLGELLADLQLLGDDLCVFFSQVFMKPPGVGGPKPIHQDNFYFGPDDEDAMLTAWVALDEATTENGCLNYG